MRRPGAPTVRHEGGKIGPDLTGMAVRERADLAIDVLDPNRSVEGNYRQYTILTKDGRVLAGLLLSETKTSVELLDSTAKKHDVLREDIDALRALWSGLPDHEVVVYPGAEHGFVHDPDRPAHRPDDAADAWRRALAFLLS